MRTKKLKELSRHASGIHGFTPFDYAIQVAEEVGMPMMVHIDEPPPSYEELVDAMRPGDVLTHCFRPFPNTPLAPDGTVKPEVLAARGRADRAGQASGILLVDDSKETQPGEPARNAERTSNSLLRWEAPLLRIAWETDLRRLSDIRGRTASSFGLF